MDVIIQDWCFASVGLIAVVADGKPMVFWRIDSWTLQI